MQHYAMHHNLAQRCGLDDPLLASGTGSDMGLLDHGVRLFVDRRLGVMGSAIHGSAMDLAFDAVVGVVLRRLGVPGLSGNQLCHLRGRVGAHRNLVP
jgi:hypothetical protein